MNFPEICLDCPEGRISDQMMSTSCKKCETNFYSKKGASECISCSYGRWSEQDSGVCTHCSPMFLGSENCDVPILGMILLWSFLVIAFIFARYLRKWYHRQEEMKNRLRVEVAKHRRLLKTKCM